MKLSCGIVMDLLPLYEEGICSEETRQAVEEHLKECHTCRSFLEDVHSFEKEKPVIEVDKKTVRCFKKIKKYWISSILIIILLMPILHLSWNEVRKTGVHFSNMRELYICHQFLQELQEEDYEGAFEYMNVEGKKIQFGSLGSKKLENFEEKAYEVFLESAKGFQEIGGIQGFRCVDVVSYTQGNGKTEYNITCILEMEDIEPSVEFHVCDSGISFFGTNNPYSTDPISYFGMWSYWLWDELSDL